MLDAAFLDAPAVADHTNEAFHDVEKPDQNIGLDAHCICHVLHHGIAGEKLSAQGFGDRHIKPGPFADLVAHGLQHKPGLQPPAHQIS